jgi:hypothetical protein
MESEEDGAGLEFDLEGQRYRVVDRGDYQFCERIPELPDEVSADPDPELCALGVLGY